MRKLLILQKIIAPLKYRDFRLLWISQSISSFGNPFQVIALVWLILQQLKASPLDLAGAMLALAIPQALVTLGGGIVTDRFNARTVMIWSDGTRIFTSGTIALLALLGILPFWLLALLLILHGIANGIFNPATASIPPYLVPLEALDSANSLTSLVTQLGSVLGAIPAGFVVAYSNPALAFVVNSFSFVVAFLADLLMTPLTLEPKNKQTSLLQEAHQGMHYLWSIPWLIAIFFMDACAAVAAIGPLAVGLPLLARNVFHTGAQGYSLLLWSYSLGAIFGMLFPSIFSPHRHRGRFLCLVQFIEVPLLIGIALGSLPIVMLCLMSLGLLNGYLNVLFLSLLQANVPKRMLGRMMSFYVLASVGFAPLSLYASGLIVNSASVQVLFMAASILTLLGATLGVLIPSLRRLD